MMQRRVLVDSLGAELKLYAPNLKLTKLPGARQIIAVALLLRATAWSVRTSLKDMLSARDGSSLTMICKHSFGCFA